ERVGDGELTEIVVDGAEVVQRHRDIGIVGTILLLEKGERLLGERQRFLVLPGPIKLFQLRRERARLIVRRASRRAERKAQRECGDRSTDRCFQGLHDALLRHSIGRYLSLLCRQGPDRFIGEGEEQLRASSPLQTVEAGSAPLATKAPPKNGQFARPSRE